jgi:hypothetical protein
VSLNPDYQSEWERFKQQWEPSEDLSKEEREFDRMGMILFDLNRQLQTSGMEVRKVLDDVRAAQRGMEEAVRAARGYHDRILESNDRTLLWWEAQVTRMEKLLKLAAAIGIEVDLGPALEQEDP